jgi:hypothetical protein
MKYSRERDRERERERERVPVAAQFRVLWDRGIGA